MNFSSLFTVPQKEACAIALQEVTIVFVYVLLFVPVVVRNGTFVSPPYRIITGWGDWFWVRSSLEPRVSSSGQFKGFKTRTWIVA